MANTIQLKRKTTAGPPALGSLAVGEVCLVIPDESMYWKKDAGTLIGPLGVGTVASWGAITGSISSQADLSAALGLKADAADAALTGTPTAPTAPGGNDTNQIATTAFVQAAISALIGGAPGALDTLNELAAALADDATFSATITASLATKLDVNSNIDGGTIS